MVLGRRGVKHDVRIGVDSRVQPGCLFFLELDLFLIDHDVLWFADEVLPVILSV